MPAAHISSIARLYERQRAAARNAVTRDRSFSPLPPKPAKPVHAQGAWPMADLEDGQCRFACTPDHAPRGGHRFCGQPVTFMRGRPLSWCSEHLARVAGAPGHSAGGKSLADLGRPS
ncbi:hypothetical protein [Methylobacterium sp. D54C]